MDTYGNVMRGLGKSTLAMIVSLSGSCLFRVIWIYTVFIKWHTLEILYIVYPVSWLLTTLIYVAIYYPYANLLERNKKPVIAEEGGNYQ